MKLEGRTVTATVLGAMLVMGIASAPDAAWVNATGNLAGQPSECGDLQSIWAVPGVNKIITGVASNGLYATGDGGATWSKISGSAIAVRLMEMRFDPDHPDTWYAGGIYHIPGICKTTDGGATWAALGSVGGNDGFAVDFSDPQRKTLLAGGHESSNTLFKSADGGQTWNNIGGPGGGYSQFPYIVNTQTFLMGIQNTGYFRSVNGGGAWTLVSSTPPSTRLTKTTAGDLYYVGSNKVVRGTADGSTWTVLPSLAGGVTLAGAAPVELPGGKIAVLTSDGISISADKGATWKSGCRSLPTQVKGFWAFGAIMSLAYNSVAGAFYTFYWNCVFTNAAILSDEIWRFDTLVGSTDVVVPQRVHLSRASTEIGENLQAFDASGRVVHRSATRLFGTARTSQILFVKMPDGEVVKKLAVTH